MINNRENIKIILMKPNKNPKVLSIKSIPFIDKILDKKLKIIESIIKTSIKTVAAAITSRIAVAFKKPESTIFAFSKDIYERYTETTHFVKDKNSFTKPLDKPNNVEKIVKERKIKSTMGIFILFKRLNY